MGVAVTDAEKLAEGRRQIEKMAVETAALVEKIGAGLFAYGDLRAMRNDSVAESQREVMHAQLDVMLDNMDGTIVLARKYGFIK